MSCEINTRIDEILTGHGYVRVCEISGGLPSLSYWHPEKRYEIVIAFCGNHLLVKAMKKYLVRGQTEDGRKTFVRDLPALLTYMEDHFPEAHLYLGFFRDITPSMVPGYADAQGIARKHNEAVARRESLVQQIEERRTLAKHSSNRPGPKRLGAMLRHQAEAFEAEEAELRAMIQNAGKRLASYNELIAQYLQHGRATILAFGYSTPLFRCCWDDLPSTLQALDEDVMSTHQRSVRQKLEGGQLKVYIDELRFPWLLYSAEVAGIFSPAQLEESLGSEPRDGLADLACDVRSMLFVTPAEDIDAPGFREPAARIPAQAFREFLKRAELIPPPDKRKVYPTEGIWIGNVVRPRGSETIPFLLPLDKLVNGYCCGVSGSGKSYLARVVAEGAIAEGVRVVVLDPSDQWVGLLFPADDPAVLKRYRIFDMASSVARGFPVDYFAPAAAIPLPDLQDVFKANAIVSLLGMTKLERCDLAADLLTSILQRHSASESEHLRTLVIIDEAHRFTRDDKEPAEDASAAARAERAIDLIAREGRKYGLNVFVISQTIRDFARRVATVRLNTNTKFFLRNFDIELDYAEGYVADASQIAALQTGEAFVCNADLGGATKIAVRPPFSKVGEVSRSRLAEVLGTAVVDSPAGPSEPLSDLDRRLIQLAAEHLRREGEPIIMTEAMRALGVTSGRQQVGLVDSLEKLGLIRTERLKRRGAPRAIYPIER